jgi:hypothetical protein
LAVLSFLSYDALKAFGLSGFFTVSCCGAGTRVFLGTVLRRDQKSQS